MPEGENFMSYEKKYPFAPSEVDNRDSIYRRAVQHTGLWIPMGQLQSSGRVWTRFESLHVLNVTPTSVKEAPGSPYTMPVGEVRFTIQNLPL